MVWTCVVTESAIYTDHACREDPDTEACEAVGASLFVEARESWRPHGGIKSRLCSICGS